jgi:dihydroorotase
MTATVITQATVINEGQRHQQDVLIRDGLIAEIGSDLTAKADKVIEAPGQWLLPGMIDDQVHFRDPGLTHKGSIATESKAAVAGGTTTFMDMPNVKPATTSLEALEAKHAHAAQNAWANYSFYLGATNDNIEQVKALDPHAACGVKIFMGASTGNMLVDREVALEQIFTHSPTLITTHCEDTPMIQAQEALYREKYGEDVPMWAHPDIRCREACYKSSSFAVDLARKTGANLHVLHLTTADEMALFEPGPVAGKQITAEACTHHLWFCDEDYERLGTLIKCNPAIKSRADRDAIRQAVRDGRIDIIATDHAPHTWDEKQNRYFQAPAGLPQVQKSLVSLMELVHQGVFDLETVVQKTAHNVAIRYQIANRGFIREGYAADLVLVDPNRPHTDEPEEVLYHCGWSPWSGQRFQSSITATLVNGQLIYNQGEFAPFQPGQRLTFSRD